MALVRSRQDKMIAGVCGGIANSLGWSQTMVRIVFVLGSIMSGGTGILVYIILWFLMPKAQY